MFCLILFWSWFSPSTFSTIFDKHQSTAFDFTYAIFFLLFSLSSQKCIYHNCKQLHKKNTQQQYNKRAQPNWQKCINKNAISFNIKKNIRIQNIVIFVHINLFTSEIWFTVIWKLLIAHSVRVDKKREIERKDNIHTTQSTRRH